MVIGIYYFNKVGGETDGGSLEKETIYPNGIEGFCHVEKNHSCQSHHAEVPSHSVNEASQLKSRATAARMQQRVDVAVRKAASNVRL
jgi:hypothetical protein